MGSEYYDEVIWKAYRNLAAAVLEQAVKDYRLRLEHTNSTRVCEESFFHGQWFEDLSWFVDIDPSSIRKLLRI